MYPYLEKCNEVYERWTPIAAGLREPNEDEKRLMAVVKAALDAGVFYSTDMRAYVKEHADFIPTEAWIPQGNVEGGVMGYEIYHARDAIEKAQERAENEAAVKLYAVGQKIGTLYINGKRITSLVVESIDGHTVNMLGKAGASVTKVWIKARAIETAKERAVARGWRKA